MLKNYIFTNIFILNIRLNDIIYQINIPKELSSGLVATGLRLSFKGIVEDVLAHLDLLPTQKISNTLAMISGENNDGAGPENGPAKGSDSASGSASAAEVDKNEGSDKKGVVTWNDYLWDSNSEGDSNPKNNEGDENSENNDPDLINQLIYSGDHHYHHHHHQKVLALYGISSPSQRHYLIWLSFIFTIYYIIIILAYNINYISINFHLFNY